MDYLKKLQGITNDAEALSIIMTSNNALNTAEALDILHTRYLNMPLKHKVAKFLCGAKEDIAISFIDGLINSGDFYNNIAFNSNESIPVIIIAIHLRLKNLSKTNER